MANPNSDHDVIYALRTTHQYQTGMVTLADQKANILIGLSLVSFTILLTRANWLLEQESHLRNGLIVFLLAQLATVITAVWVIVPKLTPYPKAGKIENAPNPMFFGFFSQFKQQEFIDHVVTDMTNDEIARRYLLRDIYQIGAVLNRKYRVLRLAYLLQALSIFLLFLGTVAHMLS